MLDGGSYTLNGGPAYGVPGRGEAENMARFLIITTRTPRFNPDDVQAHYIHLDRLRAEGRLELSGPFTDATGGAYLIHADSLAAAEAIAAADPLIASGSSVATVKEWKTAQ